MKGLLMKDFCLITQQKKMLAIMLGVMIVLFNSDNNMSFAMGYFMFLSAILAVGTISYDKLDGGMGFLFTMPINCKTYVVEKYIFTTIIEVLAGVFAMVVYTIWNSFQAQMEPIQEIAMVSLVMLFVVSLVTAMYIPVNLKYDADKGRIILFAVAVVVASVATMFGKIMEKNPQMGNRIEAFLESMTATQLVLSAILIWLLALVISVVSAIRFMEKKEY